MNTLPDLKRNVPLAPLTTFKIGGAAALFVSALSEQDVADAVSFARSEGLELFVLGGGSNVLISDAGVRGLVVQIAVSGISQADHEPGLLTAAAGEDWDAFVRFCVERDLAGVECLSGIPGLVGGTPVQNVGAYGQEVSETIVAVRCLDRASGEIVELTNADCGFAYRTSIFNSTHIGRYIVLSVRFRLTPGGGPHIAYRDLAEHFADRRPTLSETREAVLAIRRSKSMVIDDSDPNTRCAGSFFKNPVVEWHKLEELRADHGDVPHFAFGERVKLPAAWLIGKAGFSKGYIAGRAGISTKHNLALINRGGATASDIVALQRDITAAVEREFGIELVPEPVLVGF